jgi:tRNA CCA-adding enzyme
VTILEALKDEVLHLIQPTDTENQKLIEEFNLLKGKLQEYANKLNISPSFIQNHGSTGIKQTHLKGASDLDIFIGLNPSDYAKWVKLPLKQRKISLKSLFLSYVNNWFIPAAQAAGFNSFQLSYAEHPYLILSERGYEIDIVGCFDLDLDYLLAHGPITAVDRTPWHSKIIAERLSYNQKQDVRLLKAFFQSNFVYGDKQTLGRLGFTGFSAEILILFFQSLDTVFSNFKDIYNNPLDFFNRSPNLIRRNPRFQKDFLIIIDPVDQNRNLAASISERAYQYALFQIQRFQQAPSTQFFMKKPLPPLDSTILSHPLPNFTLAEFISDGTIHYTELRDKLHSACEKLRKLLEKEETGEERFGNTYYEVYFDEKTFVAVFYCTHSSISPTYLRRGPPATRDTNVQTFCETHPDAFNKNGFYYASMKREFTESLVLVSHFFHTSKPIKGLILNIISNRAESTVGQQALSLMINCVFPLYKVKHL